MTSRRPVPEIVPFPDHPGLPNQALFDKFDPKEQLVSVHGDHEYRDPGLKDIRGPCPGLNAAANHGYIPRSGIADVTIISRGLREAYGIDALVSQFLFQTAVFFQGDPLTQKVSIGYASHDVSALGSIGENLLGMPTGICAYGHLKTEGDASPTRGDFYAPEMNSNCASYPKFYNELLDLSNKKGKGLITPPVLAEHQHNRKMYSEANNPNYFAPPFSAIAFTPAAHQFIFAFFANHSAENPQGFLEHHVMDSFFSYKVQPDGSRKYSYGKDRIPENWYRRSTKNPWGVLDIVLGLAQQCLAFPSTCKVGGNLGTVNSFAGVDLNDISGGLINTAKDLQDPKKIGCFISQMVQSEVPSSLEKVFTGALLRQALGLVSSRLLPALSAFGECPNMPKGKGVNQYAAKYPGANVAYDKSREETAKDKSGYPQDAPR